MNLVTSGSPHALSSDEVIGAQLVNSPAPQSTQAVVRRCGSAEDLMDRESRDAFRVPARPAFEVFHVDLQPGNALHMGSWPAAPSFAEDLTGVRGSETARMASDPALTLDPQAIHAEAADEGYDQPPAEALAGAKRVLRRFPLLHALDTDIYPTPDAEVAILASGSRPRSSVLLQCDGAGQVRCSINIAGRHRRALYDKESFSRLSDNFIAAALADLDG